jgi:hypothetical protein
VYIVSRDPDLKECCSPADPLLHAASVAEIISRATVSAQTHDKLIEVLGNHAKFLDDLRDQLAEISVEVSGHYYYGPQRTTANRARRDGGRD